MATQSPSGIVDQVLWTQEDRLGAGRISRGEVGQFKRQIGWVLRRGDRHRYDT